MADLLIKGMEMPTNCPCELVGAGYDLCCSFAWGVPARVKEYYECCQNDTRPSWCPLVPVPPHGRLIDANELLKRKGDCYDHEGHLLYAVGAGDIMLAPTVIEASEEE